MERLVIRGQHLVISALYLDTHLLTVRIFLLLFLPAPMKKTLNAESIIQLCVSVSKGQLAISTVSPCLSLPHII